jgi:hypothetical protein
MDPHPTGTIFHYRSSSVRILQTGRLLEIRRGILRFQQIRNPRVWPTVHKWHSSIDSQMYRPENEMFIHPHWNADQVFLSRWLLESNLPFVPTDPELIATAQHNLQQAMLDYQHALADPTCGHEHRTMLKSHMDAHYECLQELERGSFMITSPFSKLLVVDDRFGHIYPVYMNLETGVLGVRRFSRRSGQEQDTFGYSFQDLRIEPRMMYLYEFGAYQRIN